MFHKDFQLFRSYHFCLPPSWGCLGPGSAPLQVSALLSFPPGGGGGEGSSEDASVMMMNCLLWASQASELAFPLEHLGGFFKERPLPFLAFLPCSSFLVGGWVPL